MSNTERISSSHIADGVSYANTLSRNSSSSMITDLCSPPMPFYGRSSAFFIFAFSYFLTSKINAEKAFLVILTE